MSAEGLFVFGVSLALLAGLIGALSSPSKPAETDSAKSDPHSPEVTPELVDEPVADKSSPSEAMVAPPTPSILTKQRFFEDITQVLEAGIRPIDTGPIGFFEGFGEGGDAKAWERRVAPNMRVIDVATKNLSDEEAAEVLVHEAEHLRGLAEVGHMYDQTAAYGMASRFRADLERVRMEGGR